MGLFKKFMMASMGWLLAMLKVVVVLFILAIAKVLLRTNPDIAIPTLGVAAILFLLWYFSRR
ncbi:MAG: hypothetical protein K9L22_05650 [Methylococcaceae bacterium]|nr:hypothetical protein [Methylococcaceae bacterium]